MKEIRQILIVDDDPINNFLCREVIREIAPEIPLNDFTSPEKGLDYISSMVSPSAEVKSILLLLDINMPVLNGWEFMEKFHLLPEGLQEQFVIYILSSSVDPADKERASNDNLISGFMEKPLHPDRIEALIS